MATLTKDDFFPKKQTTPADMAAAEMPFWGRGWRSALASTLADTQQEQASILQNLTDEELPFQYDAEGRPYLVEGNQRVYLNMPGPSQQDAVNAIRMGATMVPGAGIAAKAGLWGAKAGMLALPHAKQAVDVAAGGEYNPLIAASQNLPGAAVGLTRLGRGAAGALASRGAAFKNSKALFDTLRIKAMQGNLPKKALENVNLIARHRKALEDILAATAKGAGKTSAKVPKAAVSRSPKTQKPKVSKEALKPSKAVKEAIDDAPQMRNQGAYAERRGFPGSLTRSSWMDKQPGGRLGEKVAPSAPAKAPAAPAPRKARADMTPKEEAMFFPKGEHLGGGQYAVMPGGVPYSKMTAADWAAYMAKYYPK